MSYRAKYIVIGEDQLPVVFSELMEHATVARALSAQAVVGAGFCYVDHKTGLYTCYGESVSLKVKSRGALDEKRLNKLLGQAHDN